MRHIISFILITIAIIAIADDTIVIVKRDGRMLALKTEDIDSIRTDDSNNINPTYYNFIDTIHVHDTAYIVRDRYQCVSVSDADNWYVNIENPVTTSYINEVDYTGSENDYSFSNVTSYSSTQTAYRKDQPRGVQITWRYPSTDQSVILSQTKDFSVIDSTYNVQDNAKSYELYNLIPGNKYYYRVMAGENKVKEGHFTITGQVRMMYLPSLNNVRDLGGWPTEDGHHLRYGRIFRGGEMNDYYNIKSLGSDATHKISSADSTYMHDDMNIRLDMDLRDNRDMNLTDQDPTNDRNHTELGSDVTYYNESVNYNVPYFYIYSYYWNYKFGRTLNKIISTLKDGHNVYFHCVWGADRTGTVAMLIEGLCGVSEADINKDFELTAFYSYRDRTTAYWCMNLRHIKSLQGETLRDKFETYCKRIGVSAANIAALREMMVE